MNNTTRRPIIGILMDWQVKGSFSPRPHYAIRDSYFQAVWDAGGLPVGLPLLEAAGNDYLTHVDGVVVPGGDYPSPSRWYGDAHGIADEHPRSVVNEQLIRDLLLLDKPFLAICAGHQEMAAATGGLLYWRVMQSLPGAGNHRGVDPSKPTHAVNVTPGTLLHRLVKTESFEVNSHHHEAVKSLGDTLVVSGRAPDGVIEAIEVPGKRFALGVQWHPEFGLSEADHALFVGLVEASR
jgi:putative glutamine amidotransferase